MNHFLNYVPPMGIYETLYAFQDVFGTPMGEVGTHPWSQGFPLTTQIQVLQDLEEYLHPLLAFEQPLDQYLRDVIEGRII